MVAGARRIEQFAQIAAGAESFTYHFITENTDAGLVAVAIHIHSSLHR